MSIVIHDKKDKTYIVLGAPLGGTSFISKALHRRGVDMGDIGAPFYEDGNFWKFNRDILKEAGGTNINPPSSNAITKAVQKNRGRLLKLIKKKPFWGFKDPQTALTIKAMLPYFKDDVYLVCIFRKPNKAAAALSRSKPEITREKSLEVVKNHYNSIIEAIQHFLEI